MKYKLNLALLRPGDIVLAGYNDNRSRRIQKETNSKYSHAMLVWYDSLIHAGDIVITENPSRQLFDEDEAVCVLRLKNRPGTQMQISFLIQYALRYVGTLYDTEALKSMIKGEKPNYNPNRQMCSKFVAQCFEYVCRDLVDDADSCSPQDLYDSDEVEIIQDVLIKANEWDEKFANSPDVTYRQYRVICDFIKELNKRYPQADIMSFQQLHTFLSKQPEKSDEVTKLLEEVGYMDLWQKEEELCPYLYDKNKFKDFFEENQINQALSVKKGSERIIHEKMQEIEGFKDLIAQNGNLSYYNAQINLFDNIIKNAQKRIEVANQVLNDIG